jgi:hypothetical protein
LNESSPGGDKVHRDRLDPAGGAAATWHDVAGQPPGNEIILYLSKVNQRHLLGAEFVYVGEPSVLTRHLPGCAPPNWNV